MSLRERGEQQDPHSTAGHRINILAEFLHGLPHIVIGTQGWTNPLEGVEPEAQRNHAEDHDVLD